MLEDLNILEKKIRKMNITDDDIPFLFIGYTASRYNVSKNNLKKF